MVSVEEIDYMREFIEEIRQETGVAARRFHTVLRRARALAEQRGTDCPFGRFASQSADAQRILHHARVPGAGREVEPQAGPSKWDAPLSCVLTLVPGAAPAPEFR